MSLRPPGGAWRRHVSLLVSVVLVLGMSTIGVVAARHASQQAVQGHRVDELAHQQTLSHLTELANLVTADAMLREVAHVASWSSGPGDPRTVAQLQQVVRAYPTLDAGAVLVDGTGLPLGSYAPNGALPTAGDPGWEPLRAKALRADGSLPVSDVLTTGSRPAIAVGVPVELADRTTGLLIGLWSLAGSDLQRYNEQLTSGGTHQGFVVDSRGIVISSTEPQTLGQPLPDPAVREALAGAPASGVLETTRDGEPMVTVQAAAGSTGWRGMSVVSSDQFEGSLVRSGRVVQIAVVALLLIAGMALIGMHRKRERALRTTALRDELTGAYNRRGWFALAEHELARAARTGTDRVLLFIDVDGLKQVNDTLGHREGDRAIVDAAEVLTAASRSSDLVGRLGGDEFVLLLGDAGDVEVARRRVLDALARHNDSSSARFELRLSVGAEVWFPDSGWSLDELVRRADEGMYDEKRRRPRRSQGVIRLPEPRPEDALDLPVS